MLLCELTIIFCTGLGFPHCFYVPYLRGMIFIQYKKKILYCQCLKISKFQENNELSLTLFFKLWVLHL